MEFLYLLSFQSFLFKFSYPSLLNSNSFCLWIGINGKSKASLMRSLWTKSSSSSSQHSSESSESKYECLSLFVSLLSHYLLYFIPLRAECNYSGSSVYCTDDCLITYFLFNSCYKPLNNFLVFILCIRDPKSRPWDGAGTIDFEGSCFLFYAL